MNISPLSATIAAPSVELRDSGVPPERPLRIFLALWPSYETAQTMLSWVNDAHRLCGGRKMAPETLHLTLAFLGSTPAHKAYALAHDMAQWRLSWHALALTRFGRFEGPGVVWAGVTNSDDERIGWLDALHDTIWQRLEALGFAHSEQRFRPHVSLLRKAGPGDITTLKRPELVWRPERCVLVASQPGEHTSLYKELASVQYELKA